MAFRMNRRRLRAVLLLNTRAGEGQEETGEEEEGRAGEGTEGIRGKG